MIARLFPSIILKESQSLVRSLVERELQKLTKGRLIVDDEQTGDQLVFGKGHEVVARMRVRNPLFYRKLVLSADIGLGESYVDGDWESDSVADVLRWFILNVDTTPSMSGSRAAKALLVNGMRHVNRWQHSLRRNSLTGSKKNIKGHYDLGNDFFATFLDETMTYSAALFDQSEDLKDAQLRKLQNLAEMAKVKPGQQVLEVGTGWGEFSCFLAENYGCQVTTLTISDEQFAFAQDKVQKRGLSDKVTILNTDYRLFHGQFDRVFTVEMLEAVGHEYLPLFFENCSRWLKPEGLMAHQVILSPDSRYEQFSRGIDWIQKHIFPGSLLPSLSALLEAMNKDGQEFMLQDYHDMGLDYAKTLRSWRQRFESRIEDIRAQGYDASFTRKWIYYFSYCEAAFLMRNITVAQMLFSRPNNYRVDGRD
jgi:cyclopropane-fatty-acyl-phospholipid synthase